jgi:hypothetical protein
MPQREHRRQEATNRPSAPATTVVPTAPKPLERKLIEVDKSTDTGGKKLLGQAAILLLVACRLPEVIMETGGWRAWLGSILGTGLLLFFITDLRDFIRRRRAIHRALVTQRERSLPEASSPSQDRPDA